MISLLIFAVLLPVFAYKQGPITNVPPMGWSSWCTDTGAVPCYDDVCNEKEVLAIAQAMADDGLLALGYDHLFLDDCWAAKNRTADGLITADVSRFPSGMKSLTAQLHALGFKLSLYTDAGERTCRGGRLGSWPHYHQDALTFALDWEIDGVKMDFCDRPKGYTAQQMYTNFSEALRETGRDIFFSICDWGRSSPWEWAPKIANMWRTGPDHIPVWFLPNGTQDTGKSGGTSNVIEQMKGLSSYASPGHFNDPDYLEIEWYNVGSHEIETQISFWALSMAPMIYANDPRKAHVSQYMKNKDVIGISQDSLAQAGDVRLGPRKGPQVWSRRLSGQRWAVLAYNSNVFDWNRSYQVSVPLNSTVLVGFNDAPGAKFMLKNVWRNVSMGLQSGTFKTKKLTPKESIFMLVSYSSDHWNE